MYVQATVVIRKVGPRIFLTFITIGWGLVMIGFGLVHLWTDLVILRVILGIFEAGLFPGAVYLLSTWYKRHEVAVRNSIFYLIGIVASGFGGILAYGLQQMDGLQGEEGWRWIFIIEGTVSLMAARLRRLPSLFTANHGLYSSPALLDSLDSLTSASASMTTPIQY